MSFYQWQVDTGLSNQATRQYPRQLFSRDIWFPFKVGQSCHQLNFLSMLIWKDKVSGPHQSLAHPQPEMEKGPLVLCLQTGAKDSLSG